MMANAYQSTGDREAAIRIAKMAEPIVLRRLENATTQRQLDLAARYVQFIRLIYMEAGDFGLAASMGNRIAEVFGDSAFRQSADELQFLYEQSMAPAPSDN
jgi:hypothetical protein